MDMDIEIWSIYTVDIRRPYAASGRTHKVWTRRYKWAFNVWHVDLQSLQQKPNSKIYE